MHAYDDSDTIPRREYGNGVGCKQNPAYEPVSGAKGHDDSVKS